MKTSGLSIKHEAKPSAENGNLWEGDYRRFQNREKLSKNLCIIIRKLGILLDSVASPLEPRAYIISLLLCWKDLGLFSIGDKPHCVRLYFSSVSICPVKIFFFFF